MSVVRQFRVVISLREMIFRSRSERTTIFWQIDPLPTRHIRSLYCTDNGPNSGASFQIADRLFRQGFSWAAQ
jgi:hypothetical protein